MARRFTRVFAGLMLTLIVFSSIIAWGIGDSGYEYDPYTHKIEKVVVGSPADKAGLKVGDRIVQLYGRPIAVVETGINLDEVIGPRDKPIEIVVERAGKIRTAIIIKDEPSTSFQAFKLSVALLSVLCWLTGYLLGIVRHHEIRESSLVPFFWLGTGGTLSTVTLGQSVAIPVQALLVWLLISVLLPLAVYIHLWFPSTTMSAAKAHRMGLFIFSYSALANGVLAVSVYLFWPSMARLLDVLFFVLPIAVIVSLSIVASLLYYTYKKVTAGHSRRQIRLITVAYLTVTLLDRKSVV